MPTPRRATYQHGILPAALATAVLELILEHGVRGFSLAEAARRSGVSPSAPYRHYADKTELLAAVATSAYDRLGEALRSARSASSSPLRQLKAMASTYIRFAHAHPAEFELLSNGGLEKARHPALLAAADRAHDHLLATIRAICPAGRAMEPLAVSVRALVHGYASLMLDGSLTQRGMDVDRIAELAAQTTAILALATRSRVPRRR